MWRANRRSNVYIAEVEIQQGRHYLRTLQTGQELPGHEEPFQRLTNLLKARRFSAAAIDAPFSVPRKYLPDNNHQALLEFVAAMKAPKDWPFPAAQDFVRGVLSGRSLVSKKPLRETELAWKGKHINVRSTLWAGPRGGAAMTAACLTLLHRAGCPIWPWDPADHDGLLIEAFPAAQLYHWGMKYQRYNGDKKESLKNRKALVAFLSELIEIPGRLKERMEETADALDAVVCAFAAIAVSTGRLLHSPSTLDSPSEGQIAVHDAIIGH